MRNGILMAGAGLAGALLLVASMAWAQSPAPGEERFGGEGRRRGPGGPAGAARFLDLTEEQKAAAREIFERQRPEMEVLHEALRENREAQREALEVDHPDPLTVGELAIERHALRQEAQARREEAKKAFEAVLTPEQRQKLEALEAVRGSMGPRGPRGPWGRRGGPKGMRMPRLPEGQDE
jgi:Spy/CpxP family protein refolding chaperone